MASDVARTWLLVLICIPIGLFIDEGILQLFPNAKAEDIADAGAFVAWAVYAILWSVITIVLFTRAGSEKMHQWMRETTPKTPLRRFFWALGGGGGIYWAILGSLVAILSLIAIGLTSDEDGRAVLVVTGVIVVIASILLTITAYSVRYARENAVNGGLQFPETPQPTLPDYVYFATHLNISLGGADVVVSTTRMRRLVTTHSMTAYAYNALVLGLLVSLLIEVFAGSQA